MLKFDGRDARRGSWGQRSPEEQRRYSYSFPGSPEDMPQQEYQTEGTVEDMDWSPHRGGLNFSNTHSPEDYQKTSFGGCGGGGRGGAGGGGGGGGAGGQTGKYLQPINPGTKRNRTLVSYML